MTGVSLGLNMAKPSTKGSWRACAKPSPAATSPECSFPAPRQEDMRLRWKDAVRSAIHRRCNHTGSNCVTRQELIRFELPRIIQETGSRGRTPEQTLSRELQELVKLGEIERIGDGVYRQISFRVSPAESSSRRSEVKMDRMEAQESADRTRKQQPESGCLSLVLAGVALSSAIARALL